MSPTPISKPEIPLKSNPAMSSTPRTPETATAGAATEENELLGLTNDELRSALGNMQARRNQLRELYGSYQVTLTSIKRWIDTWKEFSDEAPGDIPVTISFTPPGRAPMPCTTFMWALPDVWTRLFAQVCPVVGSYRELGRMCNEVLEELFRRGELIVEGYSLLLPVVILQG